MAHVAYIALGSNVGDREALILAALEALRADPWVREVQTSLLHETEPVGGPPDQGRYLNAAARVETTHSPASLMGLMLATETMLGRRRNRRWGPRTIDLDMLLFDRLVIDEERLTIPHPRMHERLFVLEPLAQIAGEVVHPLLHRTIKELLQAAVAPSSPVNGGSP